ncbi:hypothetical protein LTR17_002734 [Elasticomyces elasticus]|nr:hypothetical protein LTR17_002734 [Elasticomyces elasticus]
MTVPTNVHSFTAGNIIEVYITAPLINPKNLLTERSCLFQLTEANHTNIFMQNMAPTTTFNHHSDDDDELQNALDRVLAHQDIIKDSASWPVISRRSIRSHIEFERLKDLLADLASLQRIRERVRKHNIVINPTTSGPSEAATKVFTTPELLETILLLLHTPDLFRSEDTCRTFRDTIAASPALRRKFFRTSNNDMQLRTPGYLGPCNLGEQRHGYQVSLSSGVEEPLAEALDGLTGFTARFVTGDGTLPMLRERVLDMFVSQPPITWVHFSLSCCHIRAYLDARSGERITSLERVGGLQVRDLYDVAKHLFHEHRLCPRADREIHEWDGTLPT